MTRPLAALASLTLTFLATAVYAQDTGVDATPAHISFVEGNVVLERDGRSDTAPSSMPLLAGDRVRTQAGRVEILFADGSALHADRQTIVDFQSDEVLRVLEGRIRLSIPGQARDLNYRVDGPAAWMQIVNAGEFRFSVLSGREPQVELAVLRGAAELVNEDGRALVRAGERAFARAGAQPSQPYVFNSAAWDDFDQWSENRRDQRLGVSAQYLPPDVQPYSATFDNYGYWRHEPAYGYVWYPRVVAGWRPYYRGRWATLPPYGWTWIAHDPWGWPTHHYGRWGFSAGSWFWIPGNHWGAAWVSWAYAPNYVSWCPLGWNNRPVFSFVNINIFGGHHYEPWHAWTVVPRHHFGHGYVNAYAVPRIDAGVRRTFVVRDTAPEWRSTARTAPIRVAGTRTRTDYAVPRGSVGPAASDLGSRGSVAAESRRFPAPAREPRAPGASRSAGASAATTPAPQRNTPGVSRPREAPVTTVPPPEMRAVPRGSREPGVAAPREQLNAPRDQPNWSRYDRAPERRVDQPRPAPEYRSNPGGVADAYRAPNRDAASDRYRAVPRQDAPRPSYEPPRESPRSYSPPPRQESRPPSYGGAPERRAPAGPPPAAERSSGSDGSRSRGQAPSNGQATRRPGGR
jgi:uncharacterized protein DUF6600/FecR-like protein